MRWPVPQLGVSYKPLPNTDQALSSMTTTKRRTLYFLLGGLLLSIGTPAYLGLARPGMAVYLLNPVVFAAQSLPYLLAAGLWLPWRSPRVGTIGQVLAGLLFVVAALLYIPMVTGLWTTGGDMVALGFFLIAIGTTLSLLLVTLVAFGMLWLRQRIPRT
jgi:hypothetical protein